MNQPLDSMKEKLRFAQKTELSSSKRLNILTGVLMFVLVVVIVFFMITVGQIEQINETIHCVDEMNTNTQRWIRMELTDEPNDTLIVYIDDLLAELYELEGNIHQFDPETYECSLYLQDVTDLWAELKEEVKYTRENGWQSSRILFLGEGMYHYITRVSTQVQAHFDSKSEKLTLYQLIIVIIIVFMNLIWLSRFIKYLAVVKNSDELYKIAYIDAPTGVFNRSRCDSVLGDPSNLTKDSYLLIFDLNDLKKINDTLGHIFGDSLIRNFASLLKESSKMVGETAPAHEGVISLPFVGRYGGDEFVVFFASCSPHYVQTYLDIVKDVVCHFNDQEPQYQISYAVGEASANEYPESSTPAELLNFADKRMYENKILMKAKKVASNE